MSGYIGTFYRPGQPVKKTRAEAIASGNNRFWSGRECIRGHIGESYVSNSRCVACSAIASRPVKGFQPADSDAVDMRRKIEDRADRKRDEYDYDL